MRVGKNGVEVKDIVVGRETVLEMMCKGRGDD